METFASRWVREGRDWKVRSPEACWNEDRWLSKIPEKSSPRPFLGAPFAKIVSSRTRRGKVRVIRKEAETMRKRRIDIVIREEDILGMA